MPRLLPSAGASSRSLAPESAAAFLCLRSEPFKLLGYVMRQLRRQLDVDEAPLLRVGLIETRLQVDLAVAAMHHLLAALSPVR
ncbi:hypothetical protein [Streptomyces flavofungini]|uniref:hypothetical protein n=1 Tax=Streptomyces flavofungini TaxID=68200 RepID=UPI0034DECC08